MKVYDWNKWTKVKKRFAGITMALGFLCAFGVEGGSLWWGVLGIAFGCASILAICSIQEYEW